MRSVTALLLLLLASPLQLEGATLRGLIVANELGGTPIANVEVSAVDGANPVRSDANGVFTLQFPNHAPGETVRLVVRKLGMVVVNEYQLERPLPAARSKDTLVLLLCPDGKREEWASRFYRLRTLAEAERAHREKVEELRSQNKATEVALERLRTEYEQAKEAAVRAADQLAKVRVGDASDLFRQAMAKFEEGKVDEALSILDEEQLQRAVIATRERARHEERQAVQAYLLRGQLLVSRFQFDEADRAYRAAVALAPDDAEAHFALAFFSQSLNRFSKALRSYVRALELSRKDGDEANVATTLNNLGVLHSAEDRLKEARKAYEEALTIRRKLAEQNPAAYLPDVAMTLNHLGIVHGIGNQLDAALKAVEEALAIFETLASNSPDQYLSRVELTKRVLEALGQRKP
jgi:tetratricopeptide (TPR) repeat protein